MKKTELNIAYFILLSASIVLFSMIYFLFSPRISEKSGLTYYLAPGTSKKTFIADLHKLGVIEHPAPFYLYTYVHPAEHLKTGEYLFSQGTSFYGIWKQATQGSGLFYQSFTIVPGWSYSQLQKELLASSLIQHDLSKLPNNEVMKEFGRDNVFPEGMFFPETYKYTRGNTDKVILKKAYVLMHQKLMQAWQSRMPNLPFKNAYEALIAASLIEKEAHMASELPIIAGVLVNRLKTDMLLQFDPTVIYGLGNQYDGKLHKDDLLKDTPYNTYIHKGLPPTPIAMPGFPAIYAALHPQHHSYFYFVARGDGTHVFSKTLEEHNIAVTQVSGGSKMAQPSFNEKPVKKYLLPIISGVKRT